MKSEREKQISCIIACIWNLERWYWWTCLQGRNRDTDIENSLMDTEGKERVGRLERVALKHIHSVQFSLVAQLCPTLYNDGLQHARPPCPSPAPGVYPNSCPLSRWCHPTISSSVVPFSSCLQSFPAPGSFPMSQLFASGGQSIGVSASTSVLPYVTLCHFLLQG